MGGEGSCSVGFLVGRLGCFNGSVIIFLTSLGGSGSVGGVFVGGFGFSIISSVLTTISILGLAEVSGLRGV